jgi:rhodanese-related sulfurtransferase
MHHNQQIEIGRVTAREVEARIDREEPILFIDARDEKAWAESPFKLPGAVRVEAHDVQNHLREIPPGRGIVPCCTSPNEESSVRVAEELIRWVFDDVRALHGGFDAWRRAGCTLEYKWPEATQGTFTTKVTSEVPLRHQPSRFEQ